MADGSKGKRKLLEEDEEADTPLLEKKVRFPKGKKAKRGDGGEGGAQVADSLINPQEAAERRAQSRSKIREEELFREQQTGVSAAEVIYDENAELEDDGILIDPFNLEQEREEGYFDASGNYVEYVGRNEIKDAWLDSVVVDTTIAEKIQIKTTTDEEYQELSSEEIGKIKRSIANVLLPEETIIHALKRLKGTSGDNKGKMSEGTKRIFDQLTEDAMKLLENGEYNVYHDEREIFEREAEGYERIARARKGIFATAEDTSLGNKLGEDIYSNPPGDGSGISSIWDNPFGNLESNTTLHVTSSEGGDQFDMFGDDEDNANVDPPSNGTSLASGSFSEQFPQPASESLDHSQDLCFGGAASSTESDFVYDQSSGYYYSSSLGYYYDPSSMLYCCATSGKWYSFDEQTGEYIEYQNADIATGEI